MAPPIIGNGRTFPGHQPWPPAILPVAVPPSPVLGSLPSAIKCNPLTPFYRFSPLPRSPVVPSPLPAVLLSLPCRRPSPAASPSSPERRPVAPSPPPASQPPPLRRPTLCFPRRPPEVPPRQQPWCCRHDSASGRLCRVPGAPADVATTSPGTGEPSSFPARPWRRPKFAGTPSPAPASPSSSSTSPPATPFAMPVRQPALPSPPSAR